MLETLFETMRGKTSLLITHRMVRLEHVDGVLAMDHGRITERGTHTELWVRQGLYRRLWDLQNQILSDVEQPAPVSQN